LFLPPVEFGSGVSSDIKWFQSPPDRICGGILLIFLNNYIYFFKYIGVAHPCTIIQRSIHWFIPDFKIGGINLGFLYFNRFAELSLHKPGEPFLLSLVATLLSPLVKSPLLIIVLILLFLLICKII
jgi:hypothetical protein